MRAFCYSIFAGTIAGSSFPMIFTMLISLSFLTEIEGVNDLLGWGLIAFAPAIIAFGFVLPASLIIGLPTTVLLSKLRKESLRAYVGIGAIAGFIVPLLALISIDAVDGWWVALLGAFSGAITGRTWWSLGRQDVAAPVTAN